MVIENINLWIAGIGVAGVLLGGIALNWINKTVGIKYAVQLYKMKAKKNKNKILLKIWTLNGKPQYQIKDVANLIEYEYKENDRYKTGMVKYDYYAKYNDFSDIPVLECNPNDIVPRNPFINTSLTISGEILKKNIVDSAKEDLNKANFRSWVKIALPIIIAVGIIMILYSQNQSDALQQCYNTMSQMKSATIIGG